MAFEVFKFGTGVYKTCCFGGKGKGGATLWSCKGVLRVGKDRESK